ncbi:hypothetical protein [Nocardioides hwasunensis]|uniref:Cell envelope-related transcriptional attenuator domain-containing protein n=1 Tax=Nocardioides hwasunensis TaxID=397258 RepID=A0ABR8MME0_9ACTN|nr:hypothetical protein [Nocardioides hwasunensis]MBD3915244.1 hypothetical protein [Nocardioides hwasunensis]
MSTSSTNRAGTTGPGTVHVPAPRRSWDPPAAPAPVVRRRRPVRRILGVLLALGLLVVVLGAVTNVVMVSRLERIEGAFTGLRDRPPASPGRTFLMVGTRPGTAGQDVPWLAGRQSVEAVMLVDIPPDGLSARVETLPLSSGVAPVAASMPPSATVAAAEAWSGRRVDHLIAIDWNTFVQLAGANGVDAAYAYGSGPRAQQDYLRQVMEATLHQEMRKRPLDLYRALSTTVDGTAVDDGWSIVDLDRLLLELRDLRSLDITYAMARPG